MNELTPTEDILEELEKRFENIVFMGLSDDGNDHERCVFKFNGESYYALIGMTDRLNYRIHQRMDEGAVESDDL